MVCEAWEREGKAAMTREQLAAEKVPALRKMAGKVGVVGASRMSKAELVDKLGDAMGLPAGREVDPLVAELEDTTVASLRRQALNLGVRGAARMNKAELVQILSAKSREVASAGADGGAATSGGQFASRKSDAPLGLSFGYPETYGVDRVVLLVRDPEYLYCYWDLSGDSWAWLIQQGMTNPANGWHRVLRLYDVTDGPLGTGPYHDIELNDVAREWYLAAPGQDRSYVAEFGYRSATGEWKAIARSNLVHVPRNTLSENYDVQYDRIYAEAFRIALGDGAGVGDQSYAGSRAEESMNDRLRRLVAESIGSSTFAGRPVEALKQG